MPYIHCFTLNACYFLFPLQSRMLPTAICLHHQSSHGQLTGGGRAEDLSYEKFQRHAKTMRIGQCTSTYLSSRFNNIKNLPHLIHLPFIALGKAFKQISDFRPTSAHISRKDGHFLIATM